MPRIERPPELPYKYRAAYSANYWRRLTGRPPDRSITGVCVWCGTPGVLGFDLLHRGATRATNLFCNSCYSKEGA